jgi:hypothetical protein
VCTAGLHMGGRYPRGLAVGGIHWFRPTVPLCDRWNLRLGAAASFRGRCKVRLWSAARLRDRCKLGLWKAARLPGRRKFGNRSSRVAWKSEKSAARPSRASRSTGARARHRTRRIRPWRLPPHHSIGPRRRHRSMLACARRSRDRGPARIQDRWVLVRYHISAPIARGRSNDEGRWTTTSERARGRAASVGPAAG